MAVGWTVAATAGANRRTPCIPIPSNQPRKLSGPAPLFNCFSPITLAAAYRALLSFVRKAASQQISPGRQMSSRC